MPTGTAAATTVVLLEGPARGRSMTRTVDDTTNSTFEAKLRLRDVCDGHSMTPFRNPKRKPGNISGLVSGVSIGSCGTSAQSRISDRARRHLLIVEGRPCRSRRQSRRDRHSIAASATVTIATTRPVIQPATLAAQRIAESSANTHDAGGRHKTRKDRLEGPAFGLLGEETSGYRRVARW